MSATNTNHMLRLRRVFVVTLVVLLSIALPVGIVVAAVVCAMAGKPLGHPSNEVKDYFGALHDGELYFPVMRFVGGTNSSPYEWRIKRLNLETGVESETGLVTGDARCWPCVVNGEVYGSGADAVYKMVGPTLTKVSSEGESSPPYCAQVFEYNGQLTNTIETADGEFQLCHLIDGHWVNGRRFLVPKRGSMWKEDDGGFELRPPDQSVGASFPGGPLAVSVVQWEGQDHVSVTDSDNFSAYRLGLDFVVDDQDGASALNPENDLPRLSGWEPIQPISPEHRRWAGVTCDPIGVLFFTWPRQGGGVRRKGNGQWESLHGLCDLYEQSNRLVIANPTETRSYVVDKNWFSATFYRIDGDDVESPHLIVDECRNGYLARWMGLFAGVFAALGVHWGVLTAGILWLKPSGMQSAYRFGNRESKFAPMSRRALAMAIDCLFMLAILLLLVWRQSAISGIGMSAIWGLELRSFSQDELCHCLMEFEQAVSIAMEQGADLLIVNLKGAVHLTWATLFSSVPRHPLYLSLVMMQAVCLFGLKAVVEGRTGFTPGKWLLGIRTLRSTLRPCGASRALARAALLWIDIPFFITPIPAAISLMFSTSRQRLGDRVADTLVVDAGSQWMPAAECAAVSVPST